jgi:C4-dicarboxylate-specific signal transduction histidine kinase
VALVLMLLLVIEGSARLWSTPGRGRAAALVGLAIVLFMVLVQDVQGQGFPDLPPTVLAAFLLVVVPTMFEITTAAAEREAVVQRQQEELVHASRLSIVGELTASLAHEINQPLGAILSNVDAGEILLEHPDPPLGEVKQILADIRRDGLRASGVISHVRKLVRKREIEFERLDANSVATDVVALLESQARVRRIFVARTLWPQPAYVRGDRALIEQVLINLVMNAMDAVEAVGAADELPSARAPVALTVSTTSHGEIEFEIVDAGTGIPADRLDRLFDSFYTSKAHGMGLGLSIARSIVESHGGRIHATNNREAGATFRVTLPPFDDAIVDQPA